MLRCGVTEYWMPAAAGAMFLLPLGATVGMLARIPPPTALDITARAERIAMDHSDRRVLLGRHAAGISAIAIAYLLVTILRSARADFAPEIWRDLGQPAAPAVFSLTELWVALGVIIASGAVIWIRDNRQALLASLVTCAAGFLLLFAAVQMRRNGILDGFEFMVLTGLGLYLPYVSIQTTLFERLLALTRERANVGFLVYVVDALGYLGYVAIMLVRNLLQPDRPLLPALDAACQISAALGVGCLVLAGFRFGRLRQASGAVSG